ncbi:hypothetical protein [Roseomonas sp. WA12]
MSRASRRGVLCGIATLSAAGALPAVAAVPPGRVETLWQPVPALQTAFYATQDAIDPSVSEAERVRLWEQSLAATNAIGRIELEVMKTPPETTADALLILGLTASYAGYAGDCDMEDEATAEKFRGYARAARRAADFLAARLGYDLRGALGRYYDERGGVA